MTTAHRIRKIPGRPADPPAAAAPERPAWLLQPGEAQGLEPFTYYRNEKRGFLLAGIEDPGRSPMVVLIEWGKSRGEPVRIPMESFLSMIERGTLYKFTPKLPQHG